METFRDENPVDLEALAKTATPRSTTRRGRLFLRGPIPWRWTVEAAALPGKAYVVGMLVWMISGLEKKTTVRWRPSLADEYGLSRTTIYRGLNALEQAGLITQERAPGRCPIITIQDCPT